MNTKEQYVEKRQAEIEKWNTAIENLETKIAEAGADVGTKLEHEEHLRALRQQRDEAKTKLSEIQAAGDDTWENLKDGLEHTWTSIKDGFEKITTSTKSTEDKLQSARDKADDKITSAKDKVEDKIASAKEQYVEKRETEINKWNAEIENLEAKITAAGDDVEAKLEHEEHIKALRQQRDEAKAKLSELQAAGDDTWEGLKDGLESVWTNMKGGFEKIASKFK